ncbi:hypothetical protein EDB84DRAFT_58859 [Lactarius hengduanensis]|nr:hypothetical protein EDB84DRAFT_58859 [Lactarius hengduanensis]
MNYPHTTNTTDLYAFPLLPDASAVSEEELMMWAQGAKCAQPVLDTDNVSFDDLLDSTLAWRQSGTSLAEDTNWTSGGTVVGVVPNRGVPLPNATAMRTSTLALAPTPSFLTDNTDTFAQGFFFRQPQDFSTSFSGTPSLTNVSALPSPQSDDTGSGFLPFPTLQATSSYFVQAPGVPFPQVDIAGAMCPNQITGAPPTSFMDDSSFSGQGQSDLGPILDPIMTCVSLTPPIRDRPSDTIFPEIRRH